MLQHAAVLDTQDLRLQLSIAPSSKSHDIALVVCDMIKMWCKLTMSTSTEASEDTIKRSKQQELVQGRHKRG